MIIDRDLRNYLIYEQASVREAAVKVSAKKRQIVFCVDESGRLVGSVSNGDLIRWIATGFTTDTTIPVGQLANRSVKAAAIGDLKTAEKLLQEVLYVPLVDDERRVRAVGRLRQTGEGIAIGDKIISADNPTFVIAEIGNNHNGRLELAFDLIRAAADSGADCAKFQMRNMTTLYGDPHEMRSEDLGTEYMLDQLSRFQLSDEDLYRCFDLVGSLGLVPLCTAWDEISADKCRAYGLPAMKIASADLTNHDLLTHILKFELPLICSTGMSTEDEIRETVNLFHSNGSQYVLLHCNSTYPAPYRDINLQYLGRLRQISGAVVGYSGHERDIFVPVSAVAMGARVIEKHLTFDRQMEGNDHKVSLLPAEFGRMVEGIRQVEQSLGSDEPRALTQGEKTNRITLGKSIFAITDIEEGQVIEPTMLEVRSPGQGLQPNLLYKLLGKTAKRSVRRGTPFYATDLTPAGPTDRKNEFNFGRPWGIPVRHRDAAKLIDLFEPDFVEFHLSYRDMTLSESSALTEKQKCGLVVHAPELFEGEHILDLASIDAPYRERSLNEMRRVVEKAKVLSSYFSVNAPVGIICNVGGYSSTRFLRSAERFDREAILFDSMKALSDPDVEIWPQTMPPYPWHFGGQSFHNLFVSAEDITRCCKAMSMRVCLDTSHSKMACTEHGWSFDEFMRSIAPLAAHLHIADARGVDGEGLQIGEGDIDFKALFRVLDDLSPTSSFIPEIWQGHENDGNGFRSALQNLSDLRRQTIGSVL